MSSNVVSLDEYRLKKEVRQELETVHPYNDLGGLVQLPSLDDYDCEEEEDWVVGEDWLFEDYDAGLLD